MQVSLLNIRWSLLHDVWAVVQEEVYHTLGIVALPCLCRALQLLACFLLPMGGDRRKCHRSFVADCGLGQCIVLLLIFSILSLLVLAVVMLIFAFVEPSVNS